jgi:hypothetical protein
LSGQSGRSGTGGTQVNHHSWMPSMEISQQCGYVDNADRSQNPHRDDAADGTAGGVDGVFGSTGRIEGFAGAGSQRISRKGERHACRAPDKQFCADFPFEGLDRRGHSGLDDMQSFGGPGKALAVRDGEKVLEMAKLHPAIITVGAGTYHKISLSLMVLIDVPSTRRASARSC